MYEVFKFVYNNGRSFIAILDNNKIVNKNMNLGDSVIIDRIYIDSCDNIEHAYKIRDNNIEDESDKIIFLKLSFI